MANGTTAGESGREEGTGDEEQHVASTARASDGEKEWN
jgi:hypothetical protein